MAIPMLGFFLDVQKKAADESFKMWNRALAWPQIPQKAARVRVGTTPHNVVYEEGTLKVLRYQNEGPIAFREPILICYALVNRPYILDLQPARSVVQQLLKRGFEVYLIDWGVPTSADRGKRLHDYVCGCLKNVVKYVRQTADVSALNLVGYCMGGTMSTLFTALYPEEVHTLTLMAAPIDFSGEESLLHLWTQEKYFDVDKLIEVYGNCPAPMLQSAFQLMKPVQNFVEKYTGFFENVVDDHFVENFFATETWTRDNIPVAGETFREFVKCLYQRNQLVRGAFRLKDQPIQLERITCPLLLLAADFDHLVPPASTFGIQRHVGSREVKKLTVGAGHVGLAVSSKAHRQLWPAAANWLADHATARTPS